MIVLGNTAIRQSQTFVYDPQRGRMIREVWRGTVAAIHSLASEYQANGAYTESEVDGPVCTLTAIFEEYKQTGEEETPIETWEIDTEMEQLSSWENPLLLYECRRLLPNPNPKGLTATDKLVGLLKEVDAAIKGGFSLREYLDSIGDLATITDIERAIYDLRIRDDPGFEVKRHVLVLRRTYSKEFTPRAVAGNIEKFYTTAALQTYLTGLGTPIPASVYAALPATPSSDETPDGHAWGWLERGVSQSHLISRNQVEEIRRWIFKAWNTWEYKLIT